MMNVVLGLRSKQFERGLTQAQKRLRAVATQMQSVGRSMSIGVTAPLVGIGASSFQVAADFELAMKKVKAVSGATGSEFAALQKNARDLGASTVFSAKQVSDLQLSFAKLGLSSKSITEVTGSTLALAQAFDQELGPTADVVGATLAQFGLDASDAGRVTDVMAAAFSNSALDLEKFSEGMKNAAPVAAEFGFSVEETSALLGVLANNGIAGSDAGTKLKMAFSELAAQGVDVKKTFTAIINGSMDYADSIDVLGKRAAILQPIFGKNLGALEDLGKTIEDAQGLTKSMADEMNDTASGGLASMRSAVQETQIVIGNALAPVVMDLIGGIKDLANSFSGLSRDTQQSIVNFGLVASAIGPVTFALGSVIKGLQRTTAAFKALRLAMLANPMIAVGAAAVALGVHVYNLGQENAAASGRVLDFNEVIDAQNTLINDGVRGLIQRGQLLRETFALESEGETIVALERQLAALNNELESISPEQFDRFFDKALDLANNDLESMRLGILPTIDPTTGQFSQEIAQANAAIIAEAAGLDMSTFSLELAATIDPFGVMATGEQAFELVQNTLVAKIGEVQGVLDEKMGELGQTLGTVLDGGDDTGDGATQVDQTLSGLFSQLDQVDGYVREDSPFERLAKQLDKLAVERSLGITTDIEQAQSALDMLEQAMLDSALADPNFINTAAFDDLIAKAQQFRDILGENNEQQQQANNQLMDAQQAGQAVGQLFELGFKAARGEVDSFGDAAGEMLANLGMQALKAAIAQAVMLAFSPTPDNVATGGMAGVAKAGALKAAIASLMGSVPKLAKGGMTLGPQLALIGDNPSGREAVIPFERMGSFIDRVAGPRNMNVTGRIAGSAIVLSHERAKRNRGR